jgi:putative glycosyltransferase
MYCSVQYLEEFCERVAAAAEKMATPYEIILVNDGSPDESLEKALELQTRCPGLVVVDLSRNFGHHPAAIAGLSEAKGDLVFLIDCDLEEDPAWLPDFANRMRSSGADVVFGQQELRKGGFMERVSGSFFYRIFNALSDTQLPVNCVTARLMTRQYVDALLEYGERALFLAGTFVLAGFKQVPFPISKGSRRTSTYSLGKRFRLFVDAITSFSPRPLHLVFALGSLLTLLSLAGLGYVCLRAMLGGTLVGWASLIVSIWLFGGLTLFSIGLVGAYVGKILLETKRRPLFKVRGVHRRSHVSS